MMKREAQTTTVILALALLAALLTGCGKNQNAAETGAPAVSPTEPAATPAPVMEAGRQDGERFEGVITIEGMEETVHYEHIRNAVIGIEMDYDYESFERRGESDRECFVSRWDDPQNIGNYLEVTYSAESAETVAAAIGEELSKEYKIGRDDSYMLDRAGRCIRIDAFEVKGGGWMPEKLQRVYIIPASDGCRVAAEHYFIEGSEGFGARFNHMMHTLTVIDRQ